MDAGKSIANWIFLVFYIQWANCASVYNLNLPTFKVESICSHEAETHIASEGKSSLTMDLHPGLMTHGFCKRTFIAPESHGFFVRIVHTKGGKMQSSSSSAKNLRGMASKVNNSSNSCPLSIFNSNDERIFPWKTDPCQMGAFGDEQVKLFPGKLRMVWEHNGNVPNVKMIITLIGKGSACEDKSNKFPCLRFGSETLLCISKELVCDGTRNCPRGTSYDSDEDTKMCSRHKKDGFDNEFWEQLTIELFRSFLTTEPPTLAPKTEFKNPVVENKTNGRSVNTDQQNKRNTSKANITGDLSKYGPWGYLMLGMLLCGGALLICGLWECCCRQNKSGDTNIAGSTLPANASDGDVVAQIPATPDIRPPNYDDLDPPPSYSVLFPHQKAPSSEDIAAANTSPSPDLEETPSS